MHGRIAAHAFNTFASELDGENPAFRVVTLDAHVATALKTRSFLGTIDSMSAVADGHFAFVSSTKRRGWIIPKRGLPLRSFRARQNQAVKVNPGQASAYAFALAAGERWQELDAALAEAERNVPDDLSPYYQAGRALLDTDKDLPRAERCFRKYLGQEPEGEAPSLAHAHWRLGLVLEREGRKSEAV